MNRNRIWNLLNERPSWFIEMKMRLERQALQRRFYAIGWATTGSRSKYRHWPYSRIVGPWENRS